MAGVKLRTIVRLLVSYILLHHDSVQAQFNQRVSFFPVQVAPGVWDPAVPHWRREDWLNWQRVIQLPRPIVLEYNCDKMPAICNNVDRWYARNTNGPSPTNAPHIFHWDVGQRKDQDHLMGQEPADLRRAQMCPPSWKGTYARPRCPESNQPQVVPPLWDERGQPVTGLKWPTILHVGAPAELSLMIEDGRDNQLAGAVQPSGRTYSCDEFPPASWIEGGDGPTHQTPGTTYCAPIHAMCDSITNPADARGSEQNWQGFLHGILGRELNSKAVQDAHLQIGSEEYNWDSAIKFYFRIDRSGANHSWAGRVYYYNGLILDTLNPGTPWRPCLLNENVSGMNTSVSALLSSIEFKTANLTEYGFDAIDVIPDMTTGALRVKISGGYEFAAEDSLEFFEALRAARSGNLTVTALFILDPTRHVGEGAAASMANSVSALLSSSAANSSDADPKLEEWHITAADLDVTLATYSLETQQQPIEGVIDILEVGTRYIRGQIGQSNQTRNGTTNTTVALRRWSYDRNPQHTSLKPRAVEGPIQCGPGQPCLNRSCCNTNGKCGFKSYNCGDTCISNCNAKAMCGIDLADGKTPCGLKLCCSYYGWCSTEDVHCLDPEPQIGKTPC